MEIVGFDEIDFENNYIEVLFDGLFKEGFYVKTEFDYDIEVLEEEDYRTGCRHYEGARNVTFFDFKTFNAEEEEISINDRELNKIKQLVEYKLIDLLEDEINNN